MWRLLDRLGISYQRARDYVRSPDPHYEGKLAYLQSIQTTTRNSILAQPPKKGFDLLAWLLPIGGLLAGAVAVGFAAWRWTKSREPEPALAAVGPLDPQLERRLDEELRRFDE